MFDSLALNSPYVLIEKREPYDSVSVRVDLGNAKLDTTVKYRTFKSVIDLRKTQSVSVNSLISAKNSAFARIYCGWKNFCRSKPNGGTRDS